MTKTIFESKTEGNWFLGSFQAFNYFTCFGNDESYEAIQDVFHRLLSTLKVERSTASRCADDFGFSIISIPR